jgi:hypothetical protein
MAISTIIGHMPESGHTALDTMKTSHLLDLVYSRPAVALASARELLARRPPISAADAATAHQAAGLALRELGQLRDGLAELRRAFRSARASGPIQR